MERFIGDYIAIDPGMSTTYVGYKDAIADMGICCVIQEGGNYIPSVVSFEDENTTLIGVTAKENQVLAPERTVNNYKRDMENENIIITANGKSYKAKDITALVIRYAIDNAEVDLEKKLEKAVLTVPIGHGMKARENLIEAGKKAGLKEIKLLDEAVAPLYHYSSANNMKGTFGILDFGGSTLGIVVAKVTDTEIDVIYVDGDAYLGGSDYDKALMEYVQKKYLQGKTMNEYDKQQLMIDIEKAKISLTKKDKTRVVLNTEEDKQSIVITRQEFEEVVKELNERVKKLLDKLAAEMNMDKVYLVGGASKMPQFKEMVENALQKISVISKDPDEAVVRGAAVYAQMISEGKKVLETKYSYQVKKLNMISARSYGIEVKLGEQGEKRIFNMIKKGSKLPVMMEKEFFTGQDGEKVTFKVYENLSQETFSEVKKEEMLGKVVLKSQDSLPKFAKLVAKLTLGQDGILRLEGEDTKYHTKIDAVWEVNAG